MLITDKGELHRYAAGHRVWQGIPGIEVTKGGRIYSAFYSGGIDEEIGNYVVLLKSDDGVNFTEPVAAVYKENSRCFDECLWIDPLGRLWLIWSVFPDHGTYGVICEDPDADELIWGEEFFIGHDVMMNKPVVLSNGEWLFPIAVWGEKVWSWMPERRSPQKDMRAFVYRTVDEGKTFEKLGGINHPDRAYDEHMVIELKDGRLMMLIRTMKGIGVSYSYDYGKTWTDGRDSGLGGPNSRFHIRRLQSGKILLVNHCDYTGRNNLTALLSDDECKTWKYKLLLDERDEVSYPDAAEDSEGNIYITYDRKRGCGKKSMAEVYESPREILYAKIREEDIMAGRIVNPQSKRKCVISGLGKYEGGEDPFKRPARQMELAEYFASFDNEEAVYRIFNYYHLENKSLTGEEGCKIDALINRLTEAADSADRKETLYQIIMLLAFLPVREAFPIVEAVRKVIEETPFEKITDFEIADKIGVSRQYLKYSFKRITAITIEEYRNALRNNRSMMP